MEPTDLTREEERLEDALDLVQDLFQVLKDDEKVILIPLINLLLEKLELEDTQ